MPRPRTGATPDTPKVLEKALRVLGSFTDIRPELTEGELARELQLPPTTVNRITRALESYGYLIRTPRGCRLGPAAARLGRHALAAFDVVAFLMPQISKLAADSRETVLLTVPDVAKGVARYAAAIESPRRLRISADVGSTVPLTAGATSRVVLAGLPERVIEQILSQPLEPLAAGTITDPETLRRLLAETRESGTAFSWEETINGAWAVAAGVRDDTGTTVAGIGVAVPSNRHGQDVQETLTRWVRAAAVEAEPVLLQSFRRP